jgi:hypothetical protein
MKHLRFGIYLVKQFTCDECGDYCMYGLKNLYCYRCLKHFNINVKSHLTETEMEIYLICG